MNEPTDPIVERAVVEFSDAIHRRVLATMFDEMLFCVVIAYHVERRGTYVEPTIGAGRVSERNVQQGYTNWKEGYWNPADFLLFDVPQLELSELRERGLELARAEPAASDEFWRTFYVAVTRRLNNYAWPVRCGITDDFVVVATDLDLADLSRNMLESLPVERRALLYQRGWLPPAAAPGPQEVT